MDLAVNTILITQKGKKQNIDSFSASNQFVFIVKMNIAMYIQDANSLNRQDIHEIQRNKRISGKI